MNSRKTSLALTVFGCPELCHIIARLLNQTDLYRCLLVNKSFSKNLFPYLWRSISFSDFGPYYAEFHHLDRQQQQLQLQQDGQTEGDDGTENQTPTPTPTPTPRRGRQKRPYILPCGIPNPWAEVRQQQDGTSDIYFPLSPPYSSLTLHGHLIDTLTLEWDEGLDFLPDPELAACPEPEEESGKMQTWIYIRLLQQCPNVRVLKIVGRNPELPYRRPMWDWCGTGREDEILGKYARMEAKDRALAKVISAAGLLGGGSDLGMISDGDDVGGLEVSLTGEEEGEVKKVTTAKVQGIQEFYISNCSGFSSESFMALLQAFSPPLLPFPSPPATATTALADPLSSPSSTRLLSPRPQLRVLDISACEHIQSSRLQTLLERLPGLQEVDFRCREYLGSLFGDSGLEFEVMNLKSGEKDGSVHRPMLTPSSSGSGNQEASEGNWACQATLRVLRTGIKSTIMMEDRAFRPPFPTTTSTGTATTVPSAMKQKKLGPYDVRTGLEYPACFHWFYDHLAKLTNLRELCLVSVSEPMSYALEETIGMKLTLEEGLDRLAGLTQLEILDVEHLHHRIGVAELQWMTANWPRLREIRGLIFEEDAHAVAATTVVVKGDEGRGVGMAGEESGCGWSEGVSWLKMARPDIEVPVLARRWKGNSVVLLPDLDDEDL